MDHKDLLARANNRRKMVHLAQQVEDDIAAEIGTYWLTQLAKDWNPELNPSVPSGVPVGDAFENFVDDWAKRSRFRARKYQWFVKNLVKEVAHWINTNDMKITGKDYPNPLDGVEKEHADGYRVKGLAASSSKATKKAETVYGPVAHEGRYRNMYDAPDEHPRTSPLSPGGHLLRVRDGVYQCVDTGEMVTFEKGVHNQTNRGWNDTWPQPGFLSESQQSWENRKDLSYGTEKDHRDPEVPYPGQDSEPSKPEWTDASPSEYGGLDGREASVKSFVKTAQYQVQVDDNVFGPVQVQTRYCPDHNEISLYRVADKVYQCPLDHKVYNFEQGFKTEDGEVNLGGSLANMTPDRPGYYSSGGAFIAAKRVKGLAKKAGKPDSAMRQFVNVTHQWLAPGSDFPLEEAKAQLLDFTKNNLSESRYKTIVRQVESINDIQSLGMFAWNLLQKFEGDGVIRSDLKGFSKSAQANIDSRFAFDLSHAFQGDSSSKRMVELVIEGVIKGGKDLRQAIRDSYMILENGQPEEQQLEQQAPASDAMPDVGAQPGQLMS